MNDGVFVTVGVARLDDDWCLTHEDLIYEGECAGLSLDLDAKVCAPVPLYVGVPE